MKNIAVGCFLWGEWPEDDPSLGREYVRKLKNSVDRNATAPYDWFEFGDYGTPLTKEFRGYRWNLKKMFMFSEESGLRDYDWVVILDLDIVIIGNLDFLLEYQSSHLVTCRGAYQWQKPGGSIIGFDPKREWCENLVLFLRDHKTMVEKETRGSERKYYHMMSGDMIFGEIRYWQDLFPGKIVSYKVDGYVPEASVVRFHGKPRPHQVKEFWLEENWR